MAVIKRQKTIGIVIFRREGDTIFYLLLHHGGKYWNFPKGRQEAGESEQQTALRELHEETGITQVRIVEGFSDGYQYDFDTVIENGARERIYKQAIFFLGEVNIKNVTISNEHIDYGWFDYATAKQRLFFQQGQDLLVRAQAFLSKQRSFIL